MAKPTRIALDLTLLLDLAANDAAALAGLKAAREAFTEVEFVVSPVTRQAQALAMVSTTYDSEIWIADRSGSRLRVRSSARRPRRKVKER